MSFLERPFLLSSSFPAILSRGQSQVVVLVVVERGENKSKRGEAPMMMIPLYKFSFPPSTVSQPARRQQETKGQETKGQENRKTGNKRRGKGYKKTG